MSDNKHSSNNFDSIQCTLKGDELLNVYSLLKVLATAIDNQSIQYQCQQALVIMDKNILDLEAKDNEKSR